MVLPCVRRYLRLPTVLAPDQVSRLLAELKGIPYLVACLPYGAGLRLDEALSLRLRDIDLEQRQLWVRAGRSGKDRVVPLPLSLFDALQAQFRRAADLHAHDMTRGLDHVSLQFALAAKFPAANDLTDVTQTQRQFAAKPLSFALRTPFQRCRPIPCVTSGFNLAVPVYSQPIGTKIQNT